MNTVKQAIDKAVKIGKKTGREIFVVYSPNEYDIPGNNYHVANDLDVNTFFMGCEILFSTYDN